MTEKNLTPMMQQYYEIKENYKDCFLFFRLGDFYEMFEEDAIKASKILGITLTKRTNKTGDIPMCGVPHHAYEQYLIKLINEGYKVAICEQVSDPQKPGIVQREVVRVVTPGTVLSETALQGNINNYFIALDTTKNLWGLSKIELSTGEIQVMEGNKEEVFEEIGLTKPVEIVIAEEIYKEYKEELKKYTHCIVPMTRFRDPSVIVKEQYTVSTLDGFGMEKYSVGISSLAIGIRYLQDTQKGEIAHLKYPITYKKSSFMRLDDITIEHLELFYTSRGMRKEGSLYHVLNSTCNPMGARRLSYFLTHPLLDVTAITQRQEIVSFFVNNKEIREKIRSALKNMRDIERLLGRLGCKQANARDLLALKDSLKELYLIQNILSSTPLKNFIDATSTEELCTLLEKSIVEEPPFIITEGGMIRFGVDTKLDGYISLIEKGKNALLEIQEREQKATGISHLKVKFSKMVGYCIEVSKGAVSKVPSHYIQKQTLTNGARFITPELKEYEEKVLEAEMQRAGLEYEIFQSLRKKVMDEVKQLQNICIQVSLLDVYLSFAHIAVKENYVCPLVHTDMKNLSIMGGKHPVLSYENPQFIANDISFSDTEQILLLTGPNMAGKSTYLRMTGLLVLLTQIGSFVPAKSASIPLIDRIFTRVGASDDLSRGQSTFMVEMSETANILQHATQQSLVLLDEIGRGTSTYDGLSLAWAVTEYLHDTVKVKTIFATHYHELIDLVEKLSCGKNISVSVTEHEGNIVFLYTVKKGGISDSHGIAVAKLAGIPKKVISRAEEVLLTLEKHSEEVGKNHDLTSPQMNIFSPTIKEVKIKVEHPVVESIRHINIEKITPVEALLKLEQLKKEL